jgi:hypothetical protein
MQSPLVALSLALLLSSCRPALEKKLVGEWLSGCSIDICTITSLKADHTYCDTFDEKDISEPSVCGTWRVHGDQLVLRITWGAAGVKPDVIGKGLHFTISEF